MSIGLYRGAPGLYSGVSGIALGYGLSAGSGFVAIAIGVWNVSRWDQAYWA